MSEWRQRLLRQDKINERRCTALMIEDGHTDNCPYWQLSILAGALGDFATFNYQHGLQSAQVHSNCMTKLETLHNAILIIIIYDHNYVTGPMKTTLSAAPLDWEFICGSDLVFYKLQNDTKNTAIAHSYRKFRSTNCLLRGPSLRMSGAKVKWNFLWFPFISGYVKK